jgi:hypothetical protein
MVLTGERPPVSLIGNERTKLTANALDRFSTVCLTVGVAAPLGSWLYRGNIVSVPRLLVCCYVWFFAAGGLHSLARRMLGSLRS